jgi:hypothetical protein
VVRHFHVVRIATAHRRCRLYIGNSAEAISKLQLLAGMGSSLHDRHGVYLQHVGIVTVPDSYQDRLMPIFPTDYRRLRLLGLEAHDLALSKLERNSARDREDIRFLARATPLDLVVLEARYRAELRPYLSSAERHGLTMRLWLEMLRG